MVLSKKNKIIIIITSVVLVLAIILGVTLGIVLQPKGAQNYAEERADRLAMFIKESVRAPKGGVVFLGDSITYGYDADRYYKDYKVYNRGISGDTTQNVLDRIDYSCMVMEPKIVNLLIGINDGTSPNIVAQIDKILGRIFSAKADTKVLVQSIYPINKPINDSINKYNGPVTNAMIIANNIALEAVCQKYPNAAYVDVYSHLIDGDGNLKSEYSGDGLHPNDKGKEVVTSVMKPLVDNLAKACGIIS